MLLLAMDKLVELAVATGVLLFSLPPPVIMDSLLILARMDDFTPLSLFIPFEPTKLVSGEPLFVMLKSGVRDVDDGLAGRDVGVDDGGAVVAAEMCEAVVVFTVASVNILQFKLTTNNTNRIMVVITRIKLVTSLLPLKLKIG